MGLKKISHHTTSPSFLLSWTTKKQLGVGILGSSFIHSTMIFCACYQCGHSLLPAADTSLSGKSKSYSWSHHWPAVCPLWSSLSTSVNGDNRSYLLGELEELTGFISCLSDMFCLRSAVKNKTKQKNPAFHRDVALNLCFLRQTMPWLWASVTPSLKYESGGITLPQE